MTLPISEPHPSQRPWATPGSLNMFARDCPQDYMVNDRDLKWLDECNSFLKGEPTNESVTAATEDAFDLPSQTATSIPSSC